MSRGLLLAILLMLCSHARANRCVEIFTADEFSLQMKPIIEDSRFTTDRDLKTYQDILGDRFAKDISLLREGDTWVDFGSGRGIALIQYLSKFHDLDQAPKVYGITVARPPFWDPRWDPETGKFQAQVLERADERLQEAGKLISVEGHYVENIAIPRFSVGSDIFGPFSYARDLSAVLNKYLEGMDTERSVVYIHVVRHEPKHDTRFLTEDGRYLTIREWLETLPGIEVQSVVSGDIQLNTFTLRKIVKNARIPELELVEFNANAPPGRVYRLRNRPPLQ